MKNKKRILFLAPYPPNESPSQRYRFEHFLGYLEQYSFDYDYQSFTDLKTWKIIFRPGNVIAKVSGVLKGFLRRWLLMTRIGQYDFVFIHREAAPLGPPIFEWIIAKAWRKKIIFDFDDAIWIPMTSGNNKAVSIIKWVSKTASICRWSYKVSAGNDYLANYARQFNSNVIIVPTVVNTEDVHTGLQDQTTMRPAIGWTGTFSTQKYLQMLVPVLQELGRTHDFDFIVIADVDPLLPLKNYRFVKWNKEREAADLLQIHIGVMPLWDDPMSLGKCGFKAIQYMSLGIPAVVSPVGVNKVIVTDGVNGFLCESPAEWTSRLNLLLTDTTLRIDMGVAAQARIQSAYSVAATKTKFLQLFS